MKKRAKKKKKKVKKSKKKSKKVFLKKKKLIHSKEKIKDNNLIKIKSDWQKKALVNKKQYEVDKKKYEHKSNTYYPDIYKDLFPVYLKFFKKHLT